MDERTLKCTSPFSYVAFLVSLSTHRGRSSFSRFITDTSHASPSPPHPGSTHHEKQHPSFLKSIHPSIRASTSMSTSLLSITTQKKIKDDLISFDSIHHASSRDPTHRIPNLDVQVVLRLDFLLDVFLALFPVAVHPSFGVRSLRCDAVSKFELRKTREKKT